jgi:hypothetical protein
MTDFFIELQTTYQNYKNTLQTIAQKIGDIEQEAEEHKYVETACYRSISLYFCTCTPLLLPCRPDMLLLLRINRRQSSPLRRES